MNPANATHEYGINGVSLSCKFCNRPLSAFAVLTQSCFGESGIDYCKQCSHLHASENIEAEINSHLSKVVD